MLEKSWLKFWIAWRGAILLSGFLLAGATMLWWAVGAPSQGAPGHDSIQRLAMVISFLFAFFAMGLVVTFFWIFRGVNADESRLDGIIIYCYAFIVFALSVSILPFFVLPHITGLREALIQSPVGIMTGCSVLPKDGLASGVPKELACNSNTDQWVVNIGGITGCPPSDAKGTAACVGQVQRIQGGLVVPLYVIVLALMGAAVSMTRRVPEYQRRMSPGDPEFLNWDQAREGLVFQIMQVASAPMIAVTIYYIVDPGSRATTIALGFASGFSSETVLLVIRALLEKIKPVAPSPAFKPVLVEIMPGRLDFGSVSVDTVSKKTVGITNSGAADLVVTSISCSGEFSISTRAPIKLPAGSGVSIEVQFNPKTPGAKTGVLVLTDNAQGSPRPVDLIGTGIAGGTLQ